MKNLSTIRYALGALVFALQAMGAEPAPAPADAPAVQTDGKLPPVARVGKEIISGEEFQRDLELRIRRVEMQTRAPFAPDREFRLATLTDL
ncbi:MAG: hypothetical protein HYZ00_01105, partial [Candidatus Hydrogenedentes bacterium]|nr:hypothetical protein [Candidatus Hydrogenedentota bacterium]